MTKNAQKILVTCIILLKNFKFNIKYLFLKQIHMHTSILYLDTYLFSSIKVSEKSSNQEFEI